MRPCCCVVALVPRPNLSGFSSGGNQQCIILASIMATSLTYSGCRLQQPSSPPSCMFFDDLLLVCFHVCSFFPCSPALFCFYFVMLFSASAGQAIATAKELRRRTRDSRNRPEQAKARSSNVIILQAPSRGGRALLLLEGLFQLKLAPLDCRSVSS